MSTENQARPETGTDDTQETLPPLPRAGAGKVNAAGGLEATTPILGPIAMLLRSRKGVVVLATVAFCVVVYLRDPSKFDKIASFLSYVLTVWLGSHAWQEGRTESKTGNVTPDDKG